MWALLRQHSELEEGILREERLRQHLRQASSEIPKPRPQLVGTDVAIWDRSGQMQG